MEYDRMVRAYRKIRDARAKLKAEYEAEDGELKKNLDRLEAAFQKEFSEQGVTSIKTDEGVVFRQTLTKASISDSSVFLPWVREHDALDMLQKRVTVKNVTDYIEEFGETPPGITIYREHQVRVRKS